MQDIIARIKSYRQELLDYKMGVQQGVQKSLPLIDATLDELEKLAHNRCPFCSASIYSVSKAMRIIEEKLSNIFDLPDTMFEGGFVNTLHWVTEQDWYRISRGYTETEWFCSECYTGKLAISPDDKRWRFRWDRQNPPRSKQAIASRILEQFPLVTEIAFGDMHTWYILYDGDWYISFATDEVFVEKWGLSPKKSVGNNGDPVSGYIYLLHCEGRYKIGRTTQKPEDRIAQISTGIPFETTLICAMGVEDCIAAEQQLHDRFSDKRHRGEWFELDPEDIEYIRGLA